MKRITLLCLAGVAAHLTLAELNVPVSTAYFAPDADGVRIPRTGIVKPWAKAGSSVLWFGELKHAGVLQAAVVLKLRMGDSLRLSLTVGAERHDALAVGTDAETRVSFGSFSIAAPGYARFELQPTNRSATSAAEVTALVVDGAATADAHFNLDPRRNAASVHLRFPVDSTLAITGFYNEVTAVDDPTTTYYMACGFARGYFGMQVNSPTERRIIFSVWDAAEGTNARDRSTVAADNHTELLAKGEGVVAEVFGNEGTGGHSHLVYNWKTGSTQRFYVTAAVDGTNTIYSGYWFHPEKQSWQLIASFRAPKDGRNLRNLYSFSENFGGSTGHLRRKALYGPQWIRLADGSWRELTEAAFSHDATGKENRLDRFMGVEGGRFFLSHGGFVKGFTQAGERFTRPPSGVAPVITLPPRTP